MDIEARDMLNNNHSDASQFENGTGKGNGVKDVELPLIINNNYSDNGKFINDSRQGSNLEKCQDQSSNGVVNGKTLLGHEHEHVYNELVEGHGIQPDHSTS